MKHKQVLRRSNMPIIVTLAWMFRLLHTCMYMILAINIAYMQLCSAFFVQVRDNVPTKASYHYANGLCFHSQLLEILLQFAVSLIPTTGQESQ